MSKKSRTVLLGGVPRPVPFHRLPHSHNLDRSGKPVQAAVRVWRDTIELSTYQEGLPNENPPFDQFVTNGRYNYPYTLRDNLANSAAPRQWRALILESGSLKCRGAPDTRRPLYRSWINSRGYANTALKPARIPMVVCALLTEINPIFPFSHNWMTASPVDFSTSTAADGSASVWVRNVDRVYGMEWCVQLTLRPREAVLEPSTTLQSQSHAASFLLVDKCGRAGVG